MKCRKPRSRRGFTLVELLVVIGIIALLISILLPSLNNARQAARTVQCASNMRQVAMGMIQYVNSSKGKLPPMWVDAAPGFAPTATRTIWPEGFHWGVALAKGGFLPMDNMFDNSVSGYIDYGRNPLRCPNIREWNQGFTVATTNFPRDGGHWLPQRYRVREASGQFFGVSTSYCVPWDRRDYASTQSMPFVLFWEGVPGPLDDSWFKRPSVQRNIRMMRKSSQVVMVTESMGGPAYYKYGPTDPSPTPTYYPHNAARHGKATNRGYDGKTNLAFFDGHVTTFSTEPLSLNNNVMNRVANDYVYRLGDQQ